MSKSYNAIQRRSNFMTHISKKISFSFVADSDCFDFNNSIYIFAKTSIKLAILLKFLVFGSQTGNPLVKKPTLFYH
jgi:hypothetical protein